jgi:hypothetical protein
MSFAATTSAAAADMLVDLDQSTASDMLLDTPEFLWEGQREHAATAVERLQNALPGTVCDHSAQSTGWNGKHDWCHFRCKKRIREGLSATRNRLRLDSTQPCRVMIDGINVISGLFTDSERKLKTLRSLDPGQWHSCFWYVQQILEDQYPNCHLIWWFRPGHGGWLDQHVLRVARGVFKHVEVPSDSACFRDADDRAVLREAFRSGLSNAAILSGDGLVEFVYLPISLARGESLEDALAIQTACIEGTFLEPPRGVIDSVGNLMLADV